MFGFCSLFGNVRNIPDGKFGSCEMNPSVLASTRGCNAMFAIQKLVVRNPSGVHEIIKSIYHVKLIFVGFLCAKRILTSFTRAIKIALVPPPRIELRISSSGLQHLNR